MLRWVANMAASELDNWIICLCFHPIEVQLLLPVDANLEAVGG